MAFGHGKNGVFKLDNAAGALTDLSAYIDNVDYPEDIEAAETTTFGVTGGAKTYIPGLRDATFSLSGKFDTVLDAHMNGAINAMMANPPTLATASYEYGPLGSATANPKYTGECIITNYSPSTPVGDVVTFTVDLQRTGPHTRAAY